MTLTTVYIVAATVLAPAILLAAAWMRTGPRPPHLAMYSLLAAALWPILVVGLLQWTAICAVRHVLAPRADADTMRPSRLAVPYPRVQMGTPAT